MRCSCTMVARWLWLSICWLSLALAQPGPASICELAPCKCIRGKLECDCFRSPIQEITLKPELFDSLSLSFVTVRNCRGLQVKSGALAGLPALQQVVVTNITTLTLEERSFSYPGAHPQLLVNISHCHLPEIPSYCFSGQLRDVLLTSSRVSRVRAYAFSSMDHLDKLILSKVHVELLEPQAFKKFTVEMFSLIDTNVTLISQRSVAEVEVLQEVRFERLRSDRVEGYAFNILSPRSFKIVQSSFKHVEPRAFNAETKGDVSIHENNFSNLDKDAFIGLTVDKRYFQEAGKEDLIFENNTLENFQRGALSFNTSALTPRLDWIMVRQKCSCDNSAWWVSDLVFFQIDPSKKSPPSQVNSLMFCLNPTYQRLKDFQTFNCNVTKSSLFIILLVVLVVVLIVLAAVGAWCLRAKKKAKRYINVPNSVSGLRPAQANKGHMLVVPEGKTYRETELQVIVEHADPIVPIAVTDFVKARPERHGGK